MKRKSEREQKFNQIKTTLFEAGIATLEAVQAGEEMFSESVSAIAEAVGVEVSPNSLPGEIAPEDIPPETLSMPPNSIYAIALRQQEEAQEKGDLDAYISATKKLRLLENLEVKKLEIEARSLEAQIRIQNAKKHLEQPEISQQSQQWTEQNLKAKYKSLSAVNNWLGTTVRSWKDAVEKANQK